MMKKDRLNKWLAGLALVMVACGNTGCASFTPNPTFDTSIEEAQQRIIPLLKDPESVRFGKAFKHYNTKDGVHYLAYICFEYNAKNSYGGYGGFEWAFINNYGKLVTNGENNTANWICNKYNDESGSVYAQ